jgi:hypothetical protein
MIIDVEQIYFIIFGLKYSQKTGQWDKVEIGLL